MTKQDQAVKFIKEHGLMSTRWLATTFKCNSVHDIMAKTRAKLDANHINYEVLWVRNPRTKTRFKMLYTKPRIFAQHLKEQGLEITSKGRGRVKV